MRLISAISTRFRLRRFVQDDSGSLLPVFALALVPMIGLAGAAVDYSRAASDRTKMQAALDASVVAGAQDGTAQWATVAAAVFASNYHPKSGGSIPTPSYSASGSRYSASVSSTTTNRLVTPLGIQSTPISAASAAVAVVGDSDTSCILTLGQGQATSASSMTFNGSPNVNLSGCTLRSNTSMRCNGHDAGASASISVGTTAGCSNPQSGATAVTDIYNSLATNITNRCSSYPGATWTPGSPPNSSKMVTVTLSDRTEYHVCGDLTLSGTGYLTSSAPTTDSIIVVENGSITIGNNASITALRTAIVLTGNNTVASIIDFPNGAGKAATLSVSPPTTSGNPWTGISIYQNPSLTNVDENWGPGATLISGGVVYLPKADLTLKGNAQSTASACSKLIVSTLTVNGSVDLSHSGSACSTLGVKQWSKAASATVVQ